MLSVRFRLLMQMLRVHVEHKEEEEEDRPTDSESILNIGLPNTTIGFADDVFAMAESIGA